METGSVAIAHRKHPDSETNSESSNYIAGNYGIGDMTVFLGYSRSDSDCTINTCTTRNTKTTYAGVHGGVGDTGVNYVFTMRNEKISIAYNNSNISSSELTPWTFGLSKSLGGGASVKFEHHDPDSGIVSASNTAVWLQVDF